MMRGNERRTGRLLILAVAVALVFQSCGGGGSGYDAPSTADPSTGVVVSAATVQNWVAAGKVNGTGYDRVVILDLGSAANYSAGHIPGAQWVNSSSLYENRNEGVLEDVNMVLDGPTMDAFVHKYGIDGNTTIVFTSSDPTSANIMPYWTVGRAYWMFRYWGFSKDRLKVLNGLNAAYADAYGLSTASPTINASTYSVRSNVSFRGDLRASLMDMINFADGKDTNTVVCDTRGQDGDGYDTKSSYSGDAKQTTGVWTVVAPKVSPNYVAFEGHINGAVALNSNFFYKKVTGTTYTYQVLLSPADMAAMLASHGITSADTIIVHCRTGVIASGAFVAIDAVLGWNVENYDGSWSQWGMLASTSNCGPLDPNSPWRTDTPARTQNLTFNGVQPGLSCNNIEDATDNSTYTVNSFDTDLNQINEQDGNYFSSGGGSGSSGGGGKIGC